MADQTFLGIDVGTTAIKAILVDGDFRVIAEAGREYPIHTPNRDWAEQDAEDWWTGLIACVREVTAQAPAPVAALALSTQGDTMVPLDVDSRPLGPARTWMDARAVDEVAELRKQRSPEWWFERCGMAPQPFQALATVAWLRKHEPDIFARTARFAMVEDFLAERLTGKAVLDAPNASRSIMYDVRERKWGAEPLAIVGIDESRVAEARESGTLVGNLLPSAAEALGLSADVAVALGAHDQCAAATGCGALAPGTVMLSCGTAWALLASADRPVLEPRQRMQSYCHAFPEGWCVLGAQPGGALLRWFRDTFCRELTEDDDAYDKLVREAAEADPAASPIVCLPHLYGAITPARQPQARAHFLGMSNSHSRGSMVRGLLEGVALEASWNVAVMEEIIGGISELRMIGGAAKSPIWAQIVADATGKRVLLPEVTEAAGYGAALLAAKAVGAIERTEEVTDDLPIASVLEPQPEGRERLSEMGKVYKEFFHPLAEIWGRMPTRSG